MSKQKIKELETHISGLIANHEILATEITRLKAELVEANGRINALMVLRDQQAAEIKALSRSDKR